MIKRTCAASLLFLMLLSAPFLLYAEEGEKSDKQEEKEAEEELISLNEERRETLNYGIDSEIISLLEKLTDEKDSTLAEDVAVIFEETKNHKIMTSAVNYFLVVDYSEAVGTAAARISNRDEESLNVLSVSLRYLAAYPDDNSEELILPLIDNDNKSLSAAALTAIGKCGTDKSVETLLDYIDDDDFDDELKPSVIRALGNIGSDKSLDILIDILDDIDEEKSWRWNACEALGKIAHPDALPAIERALQDSDTYLRAYAIKALAGFDDQGIEQTLIQALKDSFWRVRVSAAEALGERKSEKAVEILKYKARKDPEKNVKLAAVEALGEIGSKEAMEFLRELYRKNTTAASVRTKSAEIIISRDLSGSFDTIIEVLDAEWEKDNSPVLSYTCKYLSTAENSKLEGLFERMLGHNNVAIKIYGIRGIQLNRFTSLKEKLQDLTEEGVNNSVRKAALSAVEQL